MLFIQNTVAVYGELTGLIFTKSKILSPKTLYIY